MKRKIAEVMTDAGKDSIRPSEHGALGDLPQDRNADPRQHQARQLARRREQGANVACRGLQVSSERKPKRVRSKQRKRTCGRRGGRYDDPRRETEPHGQEEAHQAKGSEAGARAHGDTPRERGAAVVKICGQCAAEHGDRCGRQRERNVEQRRAAYPRRDQAIARPGTACIALTSCAAPPGMQRRCARS